MRYFILLIFAILASCGGADPSGVYLSVGGTVTGLNGKLTLQNNGADDLTVTGLNGLILQDSLANDLIIKKDGHFQFNTPLLELSSYSITILKMPPTQTCSVSDGGGIVSNRPAFNAVVVCADI